MLGNVGGERFAMEWSRLMLRTGQRQLREEEKTGGKARERKRDWRMKKEATRLNINGKRVKCGSDWLLP